MWACTQPEGIITPENQTDKDEALSGGSTTVFDKTSRAYTLPLANISMSTLASHNAGDVVFDAAFVAPPASINSGLGPLFNNISCKSCHANDGRARPPRGDEPFNGLLFRISSEGQDVNGGPLPAKGFGLQVQTRVCFRGTNLKWIF